MNWVDANPIRIKINLSLLVLNRCVLDNLNAFIGVYKRILLLSATQ